MKNFVRESVFKVAYPMAKIKAKHPADTQFVDEKTGQSRAGKTYNYKELKALKDSGHPDGAHYDKYIADRDQSNAMNDQFLASHPADPNNLVNTFHQATPSEYNEGKNWYGGANYAAHVIARDASRNTGKPVTADQVSGLIANYSPQMPWHQNMMFASQAAHGIFPGDGGAGWKSPHDGKGGMITKAQAEAAKSIMKGNDWRSVLGKLKIGNFGGNISTGGLGDPKKDSEDVGADEGTGHSRPKITVDRHALSGVLGDYSDEGVYNRSGLDKPKVYDQYVDHFNNATNQINKMHGEDMSPAQLQAVTWVTRQRQNGEQGHTAAKNAEVSKARFDNYAAKYHPDLVDNTPGVGFQGAGGMSRVVGGNIVPKETFHGMPTWDQDVANGVDPHPNHPLAAGGAPVAQPPKVFANPLHPLNANNQTMAEKAAQQPQQAVASIVRSASSKTWQYNSVNDQYSTTKIGSKFSCNCGKLFEPAGLHKCACGQTWATFDIVPQDKTAAKITRVVRPVKEHRDRILAKKADIKEKPDQVVPQSTDPADTTDYKSADSMNQEPDRENSATISNEFTEGIKPSGPFFVRNNTDPAPVVFDKESSMLNFVRKADLLNGMPAVPRHLNTGPQHLDPSAPANPANWVQYPNGQTQGILTPNGNGTVVDYGADGALGMGKNFHNNNEVAQTVPNADAARAEVEKNLVDPNAPAGRHRANRKSVSMEFDEEDFKLGWAHAANDGRLPKVASRSFVEGYAESLKQTFADRAPGWDTVAPAFEKAEDGVNPTMSDFTDAKPATDDGDYKGVRKDFINKEDKNNAAGQSRGNDNGSTTNPPVTNLDGWKHSSSAFDFSDVPTAALAREIAKRSNA